MKALDQIFQGVVFAHIIQLISYLFKLKVHRAGLRCIALRKTQSAFIENVFAIDGIHDFI